MFNRSATITQISWAYCIASTISGASIPGNENICSRTRLSSLSNLKCGPNQRYKSITIGIMIKPTWLVTASKPALREIIKLGGAGKTWSLAVFIPSKLYHTGVF